MPEPKVHNFLIETPGPLAKEFKKYAKDKGRYLNSLFVEFMEKSVKDWKKEKEDKNE